MLTDTIHLVLPKGGDLVARKIDPRVKSLRHEIVTTKALWLPWIKRPGQLKTLAACSNIPQECHQNWKPTKRRKMVLSPSRLPFESCNSVADSSFGQIPNYELHTSSPCESNSWINYGRIGPGFIPQRETVFRREYKGKINFKATTAISAAISKGVSVNLCLYRVWSPSSSSLKRESGEPCYKKFLDTSTDQHRSQDKMEKYI